MKVKKVASTGKNRKFDVGKKDVQDKNNARNRDSFSVAKANHMLSGLDAIEKMGSSVTRSTIPDEMENILIDIIDLQKK